MTIVVDQATAHLPATQHAAWLLVTLLTRCQTPVIERITLLCPAEVPLVPHIDPHSDPSAPVSLCDALLATTSLAGPDPSPVLDWTASIEDPEPSHAGPTWIFVVTHGTQPVEHTSFDRAKEPTGDLWQVSGHGWTGRFAPVHPGDGHHPTSTDTADNGNSLPFGPYAAACLAAAAVYLSVRGHDVRARPMTLDTWSLSAEAADAASPGVTAGGPTEINVQLDHVLAGVGAVGTALLQTLWATPGVTGVVRAFDSDSDGVDDTNLNRCVLFTGADIREPKAPLVAHRLNQTSRFTIDGMGDRAERHVGPTTHLISAVDKAAARQALADKYPASAVQASTLDLRVEMLRCDPTQPTACLRCYNDPVNDGDQPPPDDELRRALADGGRESLAEHADALGVAVDDIATWAAVRGCGVLDDRMLRRLRPAAGHRAEFSVGFVSVLAGVLLAAQVIKDSVCRADGMTSGAANPTASTGSSPPLRAAQARFTLSLLDPVTALPPARAYGRDRDCPACQPGPRLDGWRSRWTG